MEVIDIGLSELEPISLNIGDSASSSSTTGLGPGIELLMNDRRRTSSNSVNVNLGDVDSLERELNELSSGISAPSAPTNAASSSSSFFGETTKTLSGLGSMFGLGTSGTSASGTSTPAPAVQEEKSSGIFGFGGNDSKLGSATKDTIGSAKTWDGFTKVSEVPDNDFNAASGIGSNKMSDRDKRRKKRAMIKKLEEWYEKGLTKNNTRFNMDSNFEEVEDEYETVLEEKRKKDSVKLQGWWFMTAINSVEYMNSAFNPFDLNLDGWGEQVAEDIDSYEEIFAELHEKYKGGKLSPELSLLLRIGFSAAVVNFSNKALSSATPGFNDVIKQSPELMKMFTDATVQSMSQQSPGFAFASSMMNKPDQVNTSFGPPPKPVETKTQAPPVRMQFTEQASNRPDISMGRGTMFRESGVDVGAGYADATRPDRSIPTPTPTQPQPTSRAEMRGPQTDIDNILSGLKTKAVNIHEQPQQQQTQPSYNPVINDDSMISISSLKDLQNTQQPKSSRRKNRSDKNMNSISLDI